MVKDYFSHDSGARNDPDMVGLLDEFGAAGYGIFWITVELLHEKGGRLPLVDITFKQIGKPVATRLQFVKKVIYKCLNEYKLFQESEDGFLTSNRVNRNIDKRKKISLERSKSGHLSATKRQQMLNQSSTNVEQVLEKPPDENQQMLNKCSTNAQQNSTNKSKVKESKERVSKSLPDSNSLIVDVVDTSTPPKMTEVDFYDFRARLLSEQIFVESIMASRGIRNKSDLEGWITRYHAHISGEGKIYKGYTEYKSHFKNWITKQDTFSASPVPRSNGSPIKKESDVDFNKYRIK